MTTTDASGTGEATELLQAMIRNACVNDGTVASGEEHKSAALLGDYLSGSGLDFETYEPTPGRTSLVARIEGSDPDSPTLMLMGHTDVVPVTPENWDHDPFGGELIDGEVWGRGAVDMLNLTATMATAARRFATEGYAPKGTLIYLAVADEEAAGTHGAEHLVDNCWDDVACDYVITESGGMPVRTPGGLKRPVVVAEKGIFWVTLTVKGTPGHGSQPLRTDNALVKAAEVIRRFSEFRPEAQIHDVWRGFIEGLGFPDDLSGPMLDADAIYDFVQELPMLGLARQAHACTHTTFAPTMASAGVKHNVIPDRVQVAIDCRTLPGQTSDDALALFDEVLGDLRDDVEIDVVTKDMATESPLDTALWDTLQRATEAVSPGSINVPFMTVGGTDARFFRRRGIPSYGYGLFSDRIGFDEFSAMFHGDNERVDVESLDLTTRLWDEIVHDLLD